MTQPANTTAVLIGIEEYQVGPQWRLDGPALDARRFARWLAGRGVPPDGINLFVSPASNNADAIAAASDIPVIGAADYATVRELFTAILPRQTSDLLVVYWGGHGVADQNDHRLFYADATASDMRNLNFSELLSYMRSGIYAGHPRQLILVDASFSFVPGVSGTALPRESFAMGSPAPGIDQHVLFAAGLGETAVNVTGRKTGLFSDVVLQVLDSLPADEWPPDAEELQRRVTERFQQLNESGIAQQMPRYVWSRSGAGEVSTTVGGQEVHRSPSRSRSRSSRLRLVSIGEPFAGQAGPSRWGTWGRIGDGSTLATGGDDGTIRLWEPVARVALGEPFAVRAGPSGWGAWGHIGDRPALATGGDDGTIRLWDPAAGVTLDATLTRPADTSRWGVWGRIGGRSTLAIGDDEGRVHLWDPVMRVPLGEPFAGRAGSFRWGAWGRIGDQPALATGGDDGTIGLWEPDRWVTLGELLAVPTGPSRWGAWGRIGDQPALATGDDDGTIRLWDPGSRVALGEPFAGAGPSRWGAWGRVDGRPVLATAADDGTIRLWEVVEDLPIPRLPPYRSDTAAASDELARSADALALAELITALSARPPLAVGLFGDWGEGKSHFLGLLQKQVEAVAVPTNPLAHSAVRQVVFNAWHYAETDLWASLVAELFSQLVAPLDGNVGEEQRRQSRLAADLVSRRGLRERLQAARDRRDDLQDAMRKLESDKLGFWKGLDDGQRAQLRAVAGDRPEEIYQEAARSVAALRETGRQSWRLVRGVPLSRIAGLVGLVVLLVAVTAGAVWGLPALWRWTATLPSIATVVLVVQVASRFARATRARASAAWDRARKIGMEQRRRLETAADVASAEVAALERQVQNLTAAGQLAGIVADRVAGANYRSRLGMMTEIREDFRQMATLLAADYEARSDPSQRTEAAADAAGDELPRIDRIILYVDDLDRCSPTRVVEMLEAIHLLLAVELFVVVVAVDPRWLLRAIAARYHELLEGPARPSGVGDETGAVDPDDEELWRSTPAQYLEKIFQVVLTLPPLDTTGYQRLLHKLVSAREDQPSAPPSPAGAGTADLSSASGAGEGLRPERAVGGEGVDVEPASLLEAELPAARVVERVDPLTLEPEEIALLALLGPPLLVVTPRGVKRLANSYGLLTAIRRENRAADLADQEAPLSDPETGELSVSTYRPYRAGMVLLAALVAFPALGSALFLHLHHTCGSRPYEGWVQFLRSLHPRQDQGRWHNPADPHMTPVQAQQWQALLDALDRVAEIASKNGLPLPEPLATWNEWVVPVGRLSFPTGRIVSTLARHRPLDVPPSG